LYRIAAATGRTNIVKGEDFFLMGTDDSFDSKPANDSGF
jgi:hypothetical protein